MKVSHLTKLEVKKDKEHGWRLTSDFYFTIDGVSRSVPKGFPTDLASIPYPISLILPPDGEYKVSAVIHDFLLRRMYEGEMGLTRRYAAKVFLYSLKNQNINTLKVGLLYSGVRFWDLVKYLEHRWFK